MKLLLYKLIVDETCILHAIFEGIKITWGSRLYLFHSWLKHFTVQCFSYPTVNQSGYEPFNLENLFGSFVNSGDCGATEP